MTGSFHSLYYTDCLPGQGLRGGAGFQFQAVSSGVTHEEMTLVQRSALYEPPVAWMRERRPVAEYPASLTHVFDGFYVTARGIYLGAEANGAREGNQFTHAVTTSQVDSYGMVRPAQLWDADWWSEKPAASTECPPLDPEPEPGPWGVDRVREWVLGQADAEEWLIALRSALELLSDKNKRRVLFVSDDPTPVLGWIAAGTLLLPQQEAVRVGFRVFATNPHQSQHDVLAVHPDWAGAYANVDGNSGFLVFDLTNGRHSTIEPTDAARHWVPQFLRADPFDVVDAIELTYQFTKGRAEQPADRLASSIILSGRELASPAEAGQLVTWLAGQTKLSIDDALEPLTEAVLQAQPDVKALRELDTAILRMAPSAPLAAKVGLALLTAELDAIATGKELPPGEPVKGTHPWSQEDRFAAAQLVEQVANSVPPQWMDRVLRTAARFDAQPSIAAFSAGADRFAQWWIEHPTPQLNPERWPDRGEYLVDLVKDKLRRRIATHPSTRQAVREHWWALLRPYAIELRDPLDATVIAATVERGGTQLRGETVRTLLPMVNAAQSPETIDTVWHALYQFAPPTMDELARFLDTALPTLVTSTVVQAAFELLDKALATTVTTRALDVLTRVVAIAGMPKSRRLQPLASQDAELTRWMAGIREGRVPPRKTPLIATEPVFNARGDELVEILQQAELVVGKLAIDQGGRFLHQMLVQQLPQRMVDPRLGDKAVALLFVTGMAESCATEFVSRVEREIDKWGQKADEARKSSIRNLLAPLEPKYVDVWDAARGKKPASRPQKSAQKPAPKPAQEPKQPPRRLGWLNRRKDNEGA